MFMADMDLFVPFVLGWEGGFVDDPCDRGGATNMGVTLATWRSVGYDKDGDGDIDVDDLRLLSREDVAERVLRPHYWNRWRADEIRSQPVAEMLVDWVWASGRWGIVVPQRILGVAQDGVVEPRTLAAVNSADPRALFAEIKAARLRFVENIVRRDPSQRRFLRGWVNRIEAIGR